MGLLYSHTTGIPGGILRTALGAQYIAQTFASTGNDTIGAVELYLFAGSMTATVGTLYITGVDGSSKPDMTNILATASFSAAGTNPYFKLIGISASISTGVTYALVLSSNENLGLIWTASSGNAYAGGVGFNSYDSGSSWTVDSDLDKYFRVYSTPEKPTTPNPAHQETDVDQDKSTISWTGGGGEVSFSTYHGTESGNLSLITTASVSTSVYSPLVVLQIDDYNPALASGYRSPIIGDTLYLDASSYVIWGITVGDLHNVQYEAKLYCTRFGQGPGSANDKLTNQVAPDVENPQAVKVTLSGTAETAHYPFCHTFYWRVDAVNGAGVTTGDEWEYKIFCLEQPVTYTLLPGKTLGPYQGYGIEGIDYGVEGTDYVWSGLNNMVTIRKLVAVADNKVWYEDI